MMTTANTPLEGWPAYVARLGDEELAALLEAAEDEEAARNASPPDGLEEVAPIRPRAFPADGFGEHLEDGGMRLTRAEREWLGEVLARIKTAESQAAVSLRHLQMEVRKREGLMAHTKGLAMHGLARFLEEAGCVTWHTRDDEKHDRRDVAARLVVIAGGLPPTPTRVVFGPDAAGAAASYVPAFAPTTGDTDQ